jgi:hypothetical protein
VPQPRRQAALEAGVQRPRAAGVRRCRRETTSLSKPFDEHTRPCCHAANWIDFDNDGFPDLFLNNLRGAAQLFRNNRDGTFTEVTTAMGINGPVEGFSCWAWDYDNDGWLDLFATCYDGNIEDSVKGMLGKPHRRRRNTGG